MARILFSALAAISLGACCCFCSSDDAGETLSLFNGKDLDGWVIENDGQFSVRDGVLFVNQGTGWLRSKREFGDFVLVMDFRFLEKEANSGIFVRTAATSKDDENGWPDNGYQIQCPAESRHGNCNSTGSPFLSLCDHHPDTRRG